jgi:hypothetical protein
MPVIGPLAFERLRRNWPVMGAVIVLVVFSAAHALVFRPLDRRYEAAIRSSADLGLAMDPDQMPESMPPRLFALISDNSLPPAVAQERAGSGALTAALVEDLNRMAGQHGMTLVQTEPGMVTQQQNSVQVRAHLRIRCHFGDFVALLDDIARSGSLVAVDRFTLQPLESGNQMLEIWVSRCVLKQGGGPQ